MVDRYKSSTRQWPEGERPRERLNPQSAGHWDNP